MKYIVGSDKKTVQIAADLIVKISEAMDSGDFVKAEELISAGCNTPNRPLRAEFLAQCKALDLPI